MRLTKSARKLSKEDFSSNKFWKKLSKHAKTIGKEAVEKALLLYYAAQSPDTPEWAKGVIYSALVYLVVPTDAVPDFIPVVGYTDDLGVVALALTTIAVHITEEVRRMAEAKLKEIFGDDY